MRTLDIIMAHYDEPWEIGERFFQMLNLQVDVDFSMIRVILVHDGGEAFPQEYFAKCPYEVVQLTIPHGGVSAARNAGIKHADAQWISFSDFDDMYMGVISLKSVIDILKSEIADNFDMLGAEFIEEDKFKAGGFEYRPVKNSDMIFIHAKYYRLDFIRLHEIFFDTEMVYNEDGLFNAIVYSYLGKDRQGAITTPYPVYVWRFRENSATAAPGTRWKASLGLYMRNRKVCDAYEQRMDHEEYVNISVRTIVDAYYLFHHEGIEEKEGFDQIVKDFDVFYRKHRPLLDEVSSETLREIRKVTRQEFEDNVPWINERYLFNVVVLKKDMPHFWQWIDMMDKRMEEQK